MKSVRCYHEDYECNDGFPELVKRPIWKQRGRTVPSSSRPSLSF